MIQYLKMKVVDILFAVVLLLPGGFIRAQEIRDSLPQGRSYTIDEVVVTGTRNETDIRHLPMTVSVVGRQQIEQSNESSLLPLLTEQVPGLFITSRGMMGYGVSGGAAGQMSLRGVGGAPQEGVPTTGLLVLIDGHPQYMGLFAHPISDAYQSFLAERVEVLRGPASVLYGSNAMGGVINIVTRKMQEDGMKTHFNLGYGSYNTLQTEVTNRLKTGRFTSVVSASYNRSDGHRPDMEFEQAGGYAKLGYEISQAWNVRADVNLTHFNASNPGKVTDPLIDNDQRITRGMTSFALENNYEKTSGALSFFYNWGKHWINDGYAVGGEPLDYRFNSRDDMLGLSWYQSVQLFKGNRLTAGVDLGVRIDHHSHVGTEWVPQAGLSFHLPANAEIKLMAGKGFRYPTIRELYMFRPANPDLRPERLWNYELAWSQRSMNGRLFYGVNVFYIDGENLIMRMPVDGRQMNINTGKIENTGAEVQFAYRFSPVWSVDANYSYLHMEQPVLASPRHKAYAGATFSKGRWSAGTGVQYVAGLYTGVKIGNTGRDMKEDFVMWNLQGQFRAASWLRIWARGENLLAQRYEINDGFPMPKATVMAGMNINF